MEQKFEMHKNIPLHVQKLNCEEGIYEFKDPIGEEALGSKLWSKLGLAKELLLQVFLITY